MTRFHPAALEEAGAAAAWYRERSPRAAGMFLDEIDHIIERIEGSPGQFPIHIAGTRRARLRRFPFAIVFREIGAEIQVVAVAHGHRLPGYWRKRLSSQQG